MHKVKKYGLLGVLLSIGFMNWAGSAIAEDKSLQTHLQNKNVASARDILSDNADQADSEASGSADDESANDFDSNKEDQSEEAAPTPQEEEDNPLLDEEGNVIKQGQPQMPQTLTPQPQTPESENNPLDMFHQNTSK